MLARTTMPIEYGIISDPFIIPTGTVLAVQQEGKILNNQKIPIRIYTGDYQGHTVAIAEDECEILPLQYIEIGITCQDVDYLLVFRPDGKGGVTQNNKILLANANPKHIIDWCKNTQTKMPSLKDIMNLLNS